MRNWIIGLFVLALVGVGIFFAMGGGTDTLGLGEPTPEPAPLIEPVTAGTRVVADAVILPKNHVNLTFESSGVRVAEVLVEEGAQVRVDQPLARLDTRDLQLRVDQAQAALAQARADYDRILESATPEEVAEAQAQIARAQAQLREARGGVTPQDIASAQAAIAEAQTRLNEGRARLARLQSGPKETDVADARARLDRAQVNLQEQRNTLSVAKTNAEVEIQKQADQIRDRQAEYSQIYWENRELENELARFNRELPQENRDREEIALRAIRTAEQQLEQARLDLERAQQAEITGIASAETQVREAQANLDRVLAGFDTDEIENARSQIARAEADIAEAQARLSRLQGEERAGRVAAAEAGVADAQARLNRLLADPSASTLAQAQALIQQREVEVRQAELNLEKAVLLAPIAGTVAEVNLEIGEIPSATAPAVIIADFSSWKIETDDLTELSIVNVTEGQSVEITFDAIPDLALPGTVQRIKPIGRDRLGDIVYTVVIVPDEWDSRLRWNMTATVTILTDDADVEE